jgi:hypothetical protein
MVNMAVSNVSDLQFTHFNLWMDGWEGDSDATYIHSFTLLLFTTYGKENKVIYQFLS